MDLIEAVAQAMWDTAIPANREEARRLAIDAIAAVKRWEMQQLWAGRDAYRKKYKATLPGCK